MRSPAGTNGRGEAAALVAALGAGALLRFYHLALLPPALYRDVALTAMDALRAASGHPRLHYTYDEGLYANLMGLGFLIFGASDWSVRAPGALFGVLTCWGVYRLGRALGLGSAGLWGAALLAVSMWHLILSRSGFRAVLLPLLLVHSLALLIEGLRRGGRFRLVAAGALFGLGVHVYPSVRFAPLILPLYLLAEIGVRRAAWRKAARGLLLFAAAALVVALPMLVHYLEHPEHFTYPHRVVSVFSPKLDKAEVPYYLERNLVATLLMLHVRGDENWRHNLSGSPMLDPLTGLLLLLGCVVCARSPASPTTALLVPWIVAMLLPNLLSVEGVPHGLRSCGILPAVALLAGIGLAALLEIPRGAAGRRAARATAAAALLLLGCFSADRYFRVWGNDPRVLEAHDGAYRAAARALLASPAGAKRYLIANGTGFPAYGYPAEVQGYLFEMRENPPILLGPKDGGRLVLDGGTAFVALVRKDDRALDLIRSLNPGAPIHPVEDAGISADSPVYRIN